MLYIQKKNPPYKISHLLKKMEENTEWKALAPDDVSAMRTFFDQLPIKDELRQQLSQEQHHLCAYCMKQISFENSLYVKIEHFLPISKYKASVFDYQNLFLCCDGGQRTQNVSEQKRILCCDSSKGKEEIVLNPLLSHQMERIRYNKSGVLYYYDADNPNFTAERNREINDVLHLNGIWNDEEKKVEQDTATNIVKGRKDAYFAAEKILKRLDSKGCLKRRKLEEEIKRIEEKETYPPFAGVVLFVLKRTLKRMS